MTNCQTEYCIDDMCLCQCHLDCDPYNSNISVHNDTNCNCETCVNVLCLCSCHYVVHYPDQSYDLKICFINVNGLGRKSKYPEFIKFINNFDMVGISESNMSEHDDITLENFTILKTKERPFSIKASGGITVLVKNYIKDFVKYIHTESDFVVWAELDKVLTGYKSNLIIGTVYIPGETSNYFCGDAFDSINQERINYFHDKDNIILGGDFNSRTSTLNDFIEPSEDIDATPVIDELLSSKQTFFEFHQLNKERFSQDTARPNTNGKKLIDFCKDTNFTILNGRCKKDKYIGKTTCNNFSVNDYILMYANTLIPIINFEVNDFSVLLSDVHCPVSLHLQGDKNNNSSYNCNNQSNNNVNENIIDDKMHKISIPRTWDKNNSEVYKDLLILQNPDVIVELVQALINETNDSNNMQDNINNATRLIAEKLTQAAKATNGERLIYNSPTQNNRKETKHNNPRDEWFDETCKMYREEYHRKKKKHNSTKTLDSYIELQKASKKYKKAMNTAQKNHKRKIEIELKTLRKKDSKQFWKYFKKNKKPEAQPINELYHTFKNFNENERGTTHEPAEPHTITANDNYILNGPITNEEIINAILNLKNGKTPGQDFILNEYLKASVDIFLPAYNILFNTVLDTGTFPTEWNIGIISPIYKGKGHRLDPMNYRPITLLSCIGKVFTSILNNRLTLFLEEYHIINEIQAGFRKEYSTMDHVLTLHLLLEYMKMKNKTIFCGFMDLRKAYDLINRAMLFQKLEMFHIKGKLYNIILSMYNDTKSRLRCNNLYTNDFCCNIGIRQGENLSSILFAIFLNDIEKFCKDNGCDSIPLKGHDDIHVFVQLFILLYADDTVLLANSVKSFKKLLKAYGDYCKTWDIEINVNKSKIMIFGRHRKQTKFYINEIEIEKVNEFKYLGITFSKNRKFTQTIKENITKGKRAMYSIFSKAKCNGLSISCQIHLFKVIVLPILLYGCEVWGFENLKLLEKVQLEFCRILLKLNRSTSKYFLLGETGLLPISILIKCRMIKYWASIKTGKEEKIASKIVKCLEDFYNLGNFELNWLKFIYNTLNENGMHYIIANPNAYNHKMFKQRLEDQYYQTYNQEIQNTNRALFYKSIKTRYGYDEIQDEIDTQLVYYLTKFKTSNHRLPVETGRWHRIPFQERKCLHCNNDLGDEFHFLFICPQFTEVRKKYIDSYYYRHPSMYKAQELFQSKGLGVIKKLCLMIKHIMLAFR